MEHPTDSEHPANLHRRHSDPPAGSFQNEPTLF
jgi:hypothetical protein